MARKLTVLFLVLIALLYSVMVPSPDYEYEIKRGLGPQALYYYKLVEGRRGYHQMNNLLFDTGQVYPPPKKVEPTLPPSRYRKRKKRRKVPSRVKYVLPNVMRQQVEAIENRDNSKVMLLKRRFDNGDRVSEQRKEMFLRNNNYGNNREIVNKIGDHENRAKNDARFIQWERREVADERNTNEKLHGNITTYISLASALFQSLGDFSTYFDFMEFMFHRRVISAFTVQLLFALDIDLRAKTCSQHYDRRL